MERKRSELCRYFGKSDNLMDMLASAMHCSGNIQTRQVQTALDDAVREGHDAAEIFGMISQEARHIKIKHLMYAIFGIDSPAKDGCLRKTAGTPNPRMRIVLEGSNFYFKVTEKMEHAMREKMSAGACRCVNIRQYQKLLTETGIMLLSEGKIHSGVEYS